MYYFHRLICLLTVLGFSSSAAISQEKATPQKRAPQLSPTYANIKYGQHERNVLDFWAAQGDKPHPLAIYIHGGGFVGGDKSSINANMLNDLLNAGISVAAINYRFVQHAPLPAAHDDSVRAIQFLRSKSQEWNIDKNRIGGFGGSAGAQLVMYLAFHDDQADPKSNDPLRRESTCLCCVAPNAGQVTMDLSWWAKNIPGFTKSEHNLKRMFGVETDEAVLQKNASIAALSLIKKSAPPVFMTYAMAPDAKVPADEASRRTWIVHHVANGIELKKTCDQLGVEAYLTYPGAKARYASAIDFLKAKLLSQ